jgi:hypothetical protein
LVYGLNTHVHADHVTGLLIVGVRNFNFLLETGTGQLKKAENSGFPLMKSVLSAKAGAKSGWKILFLYNIGYSS